MADLVKADLILDLASKELLADVAPHAFIIEKLPSLSSGLVVRLSRENWPEGSVADLSVDIREVATKEWQHWFSFDLVGGDVYDTRPLPEEITGDAPVKGKPRLLTHVEVVADWPGENPFRNPKTKIERDTRKLLVMNEVRLQLFVKQPFTTRIQLSTFTRPGQKLIESASEALGRL